MFVIIGNGIRLYMDFECLKNYVFFFKEINIYMLKKFKLIRIYLIELLFIVGFFFFCCLRDNRNMNILC